MILRVWKLAWHNIWALALTPPPCSSWQVSRAPSAPPSCGTTSSGPCSSRWRCAAVEGTCALTPPASRARTPWTPCSATWCRMWRSAPARCRASKPLASARLWWRPRCSSRWAPSCSAGTRKWPSRTAAAACTASWITARYPVPPGGSATRKTRRRRKRGWRGGRAPGWFCWESDKFASLTDSLYVSSVQDGLVQNKVTLDIGAAGIYALKYCYWNLVLDNIFER